MTRPSFEAFLPLKKLPLLAAPLEVLFDDPELRSELGFDPGNFVGSVRDLIDAGG